MKRPAPLSPEAADWAAHYARAFTREAMRNNLQELEANTRYFYPDQLAERTPRIEALRYLLRQPGQQLALAL